MPAVTTTCRSCGDPLDAGATYCSSCGARRSIDAPRRGMREVTYDAMPLPRNPVDDLLPGPTLDEHRAELARWHRRHHHAALVLGAVIVCVVAATVAAALTLGLRAATGAEGPTPAQQQAAALHALRADLNPQLQAVLNARATFFAAERSYLSAMSRADASVAAYRKATRTQWRPDPPDLDASIEDLRNVATELTSLQAGLVGLQPVPALAPTYRQLLSAVDILGRDATDNARLLLAAVGSARDGTRLVDLTALSGLSGNSALPSIRQLNRSLVAVLDAAHLPLTDYDVPGGTDLDPDDDSTLL